MRHGNRFFERGELTTRIHHGAQEQEVAVWSIPAAAATAAVSVIRAEHVSAVCCRVTATRPPDSLDLRRTFSPRQVNPGQGFEWTFKQARAGDEFRIKIQENTVVFQLVSFFFLFHYLNRDAAIDLLFPIAINQIPIRVTDVCLCRKKKVSQSLLENNNTSNYTILTFIADKHLWGICVGARQVDSALGN